MKPTYAVAAVILFSTALPAADSAGFRKNVQPFLKQHCTMCHSTKAKVGGLDLEQFQNADLVLADQEVWDKVVLKLRNGEMPPKGMPRPSAAETAALTGWLKAEYARYDKAGRHDPGRVTARRLNRAEYNNTIRDLVGLDLHPANQFPVDDSGYGFDNIGDVLSVSPALMEQYMLAADRIAKAALALPKQYQVTSDRYRSDRVKHDGSAGSIALSHSFPVEGDYEIRIAIAGRRSTEEEALQLKTQVDDQAPQFSPVFTPENKPRLHDFTIRPKAGSHKLRAIIIDSEGKPYTGEKGPLVEYLEVRGPYNQAPFTPPPSYKTILICGEYPGKYDDACMQRIVENFARRAFRRPVTPWETERFLKYAKLALAKGDVPEAALRYSLEAILVSPQFLFRIERDPRPNDPQATHPLTDFELATRLSYFLWSSMPDEDLFQLASKGDLHKPAVLEQQVRRMLAGSKFSAFVDNFVGQWLELRNLNEVKPAPEKFPTFDNELRAAMKKETQLFFESVVKQDRSILDFIDSDYTFLNERLAKHYGIPGVTGNEFRRVELHTPQRGGLITMASVLTVSSYPTRTSPVIRGKYLLENFLNAPPPPPPPNVPNLEDSGVGITGTLRQQMEKHRANPMCAACHLKMDALGFGLENYDAIGAWRDKDGKFPIDASGALPGGKTFSTPAEFKKILLTNKDDFARCLAEKMLTYALGRGLEKNDRTFVRQIVSRLAADNYRFSRLVLEIVKSPPFQMRRGEAAGKS
jgi:mono/diheme cytochrome c family protein